MESPPTTTLGIPTVIGRRICLLTNSQYGSRRPDVHVRVLRAVQEEEKSPSFIMGTEVGMQPDVNCSVTISVIVGIRSAVQQNHVRVVPLARSLVKIPVTKRLTAVALKDDTVKLGVINTCSAKNRTATLGHCIEHEVLDVFVITETWHENADDITLKRITPEGFICIDAARPLCTDTNLHSTYLVNHGGFVII